MTDSRTTREVLDELSEQDKAKVAMAEVAVGEIAHHVARSGAELVSRMHKELGLEQEGMRGYLLASYGAMILEIGMRIMSASVVDDARDEQVQTVAAILPKVVEAFRRDEQTAKQAADVMSLLTATPASVAVN